MLSEDESKILSKQRIIQKNLVHFQGFPDRLYNKELLASEEYFGQYGLISKIILTNKVERKTNRRSNSAYITFYSYEQAAYAILSVDSIKIDDMLVRAFFGTTKYCNHFLNNFRCFNSDKCMFLHEIADPNDIITEDSKFGYSEHIKLAKKIIGFGSLQSQIYVKNNANKNKTVLPTIATIYQKSDILMKTKNHRRKKSNDNNINNNLCTYNNNVITPKQIPPPRNLTIMVQFLDALYQSIYIRIPCIPRILMNHKYLHNQISYNNIFSNNKHQLGISLCESRRLPREPLVLPPFRNSPLTP